MLSEKQSNIPSAEMDWSFIDFFRRAHENEFRPEKKMQYLHQMLAHEAKRDFYTDSLRQIKQLIQIGPPNLELKEARCEIYKISISFDAIRESLILFGIKLTTNDMKFSRGGTNNRTQRK